MSCGSCGSRFGSISWSSISCSPIGPRWAPARRSQNLLRCSTRQIYESQGGRMAFAFVALLWVFSALLPESAFAEISSDDATVRTETSTAAAGGIRGLVFGGSIETGVTYGWIGSAARESQ